MSEVAEVTLPEPLEKIRDESLSQDLGYAGGITPQQAWQWFQAGHGVLVDVRSGEELAFVGRVPNAKHVPWASGTSLNRNPRFVRELEAKVAEEGGRDAVLFLLCRSGKRSVLAAQAATKGGFTHVFNILEGFEGELDPQDQRGHHDGWRYHQLPWIQD